MRDSVESKIVDAKPKRARRTNSVVVFALFETGKSNPDVAAELNIPVVQVSAYRTRWKKQMGVGKTNARYVRGTIAERFEAYVDKSGDCHVWTGGITGNGYGCIHDRRGELGKPQMLRAHRVAWMLKNGPIEPEQFLLHACDNRKCCNPAHLRIGTQQENIRDAMDRARFRPRSPITIAVAREIKRRASAGEKAVDIAKAMGLPRDPVWRVASGRTWKHVA